MYYYAFWHLNMHAKLRIQDSNVQTMSHSGLKNMY